MKEKRRSGAGPGERGDYEIGYGRPPVSKRFQTGGIGNPRGRPKRKKTIGQSIEQALMAAHKIEENGRVKILTMQEIIVRNLGAAHAYALIDPRQMWRSVKSSAQS